MNIQNYLLASIILLTGFSASAQAWQQGQMQRAGYYPAGYNPYAYQAPSYRHNYNMQRPYYRTPAVVSRPAVAIVQTPAKTSVIKQLKPADIKATTPVKQTPSIQDKLLPSKQVIVKRSIESIDLFSLSELDSIPRTETASLPEGYLSIKDTSKRKSTFIKMLLPMALMENEHMLEMRKKLKDVLTKLENGITLEKDQQSWLKKLSTTYRVKGDILADSDAQQDLLNKIDIIPVSLTLAQAANESAWGQSRFAQEGNNLFGIWTYDESKGIVPKNRTKGKKHLIRKFDDFRKAIRYYLFTLNSHPAYKELRDIRADQRKKGLTPSGVEVAQGLESYSGIGKKYIAIIRDVIHANDLASLDSASLNRG